MTVRPEKSQADGGTRYFFILFTFYLGALDSKACPLTTVLGGRPHPPCVVKEKCGSFGVDGADARRVPPRLRP